jgi:hypothetical protein
MEKDQREKDEIHTNGRNRIINKKNYYHFFAKKKMAVAENKNQSILLLFCF